jgi:putative ABC transport system permease protein
VFLVTRFPFTTSNEQFLKLQRSNKPLVWEEYEFLHDNMTMAKNVGVEQDGLGKVKYRNDALEDVNIRGVTANIGEMDVEEPESGRYISDADNEHRAPVTFIGTDVAKRFFLGTDPIGKELYIDGEQYEVVGVAKELGSTFGQSQDNFAYIPIRTFQKVYGAHNSLSINVQALGPEFMEPAQEEARMLMRARRHLAPGAPDNFGIFAASAILDLYNSLTGSLASGSVGIVSIFLVIGGIVIMNIMLASVTERTREIGVRKSLGATRNDILLQFVIEACVMSATGGVLGVAFASSLAYLIGAVTPVPMSVPVSAVLTAVLVSTAVGLFFGVYPAHKASKLDPIEALRFEA